MFNQVQHLFADPLVTDVVFNSFNCAQARVGELWVDLASPFESDQQFSHWLIDSVESAGSRLDYQNPATSVVLDGFRLHAVLGFGVSANSLATVRRLSAASQTFVCHDVASVIRLEVLQQVLARRQNVLIAGAAGAGKTSLLRHLLNTFDEERIVTIEDVPELNLVSRNSIALTSRQPNVEDRGGISMSRLLFEALRMSPDRIAVGEVRGSELVTMLDALNTGHGGAGATIHANSLEAVATRLTSIGLACGLSERVIALQTVAAFSKVAFVSNRGGHLIESLGNFALDSSGELIVVQSDE